MPGKFVLMVDSQKLELMVDSQTLGKLVQDRAVVGLAVLALLRHLQVVL